MFLIGFLLFYKKKYSNLYLKKKEIYHMIYNKIVDIFTVKQLSLKR